MASPLCGTGLYANDVLCEVIANLDGLMATAEAMKVDALASIDVLKTTSVDAVAALDAIDYDADTTSVNTSYVPPAGVNAPTYSALYAPPSPTDALISDAVLDDIFDRESARLARVSVKAERDASYAAASMGLGLPTASLLLRLGQAQQETNERVSQAALDQAIQEGTWKREDAKVAQDLNIRWVTEYLNAESQRFQQLISNLSANVASEAERRGWSEMQMRDVLEQADKETGYAIAKARAVIAATQEAEKAVATLLAGMTQGLYSAASMGLNGSGSQSVSESV